MNVRVKVTALVYSTEAEERVATAVRNLVPVELKHQDFGVPGLYGEGDLESLRKLHMLLRENRILDTARQVLLAGIEGDAAQFRLNKQVAFTGKVNFPAGEETLGSIYVEISAESRDELLKVIDWLAPRTVDGKPVEEIEL